MPRVCIFLVLAFLAGCAPFPQLDLAISAEAKKSAYPGLEPVDELLTRSAPPTDADPSAEIEALLNRAKLLKARAKILRQTDIITAETQAEMKAAFGRLNP
jgi:hypothetical protein